MGTNGKKYCPVLWNSANIRTNGDYRMCCYANVAKGHGILFGGDGSAINMSTTSVDKIRNHPLLKEVRQAFLEGRWHPSCQRCKVEEENQQRSGRIHALTRVEEAGEAAIYEKKVFSQTKPDGSIEISDFPIEDLDLRFGNKCNLRCRSCGPTDSSSWYGDYVKLGNNSIEDISGTIQLKTLPNGRVEAVNDRFGWYKDVDVVTQLPKDLSKLSRIYFVGGEPLLIAEHQRMLEWLVAEGFNKKISLEYSTNLTVLPDAILKLWKEFEYVGVGVSMDGFGKFHEYLRFPGKADIMEKNLRKLDNAEGNIRGWLACTLSNLNVSHLPDFILWKERQQYKQIKNDSTRPPISVHLLHMPPQMNVRGIPARAKELVLQRLNVGLEKIRAEAGLVSEKLVATEKLFAGIIQYMMSADHSHDWRQSWEWHRELDGIRQQSFLDVDPELAQILSEEAQK